MIKNIISDLNGVILYTEEGQDQLALSQIFTISSQQAEELWNKHKDKIALGEESSWYFLERVRQDLKSPKPLYTLLEEWREKYTAASTNIDEELIGFYDQLKKSIICIC